MECLEMTTRTPKTALIQAALKNPDTRHKVPRRKPPVARKALTSAQRAELVEYFERRNAKLEVVATTRTPSGQVLDWIEIRSQHPARKIATPPPALSIAPAKQRGRATRFARFELQEEGCKRGPDGTVPILRINPTEETALQ